MATSNKSTTKNTSPTSSSILQQAQNSIKAEFTMAELFEVGNVLAFSSDKMVKAGREGVVIKLLITQPLQKGDTY